jgi:hypothetical protein
VDSRQSGVQEGGSSGQHAFGQLGWNILSGRQTPYIKVATGLSGRALGTRFKLLQTPSKTAFTCPELERFVPKAIFLTLSPRNQTDTRSFLALLPLLFFARAANMVGPLKGYAAAANTTSFL